MKEATYNCDTVTGLIIGKTDEKFLDSQKGIFDFLPNNNFHVRERLLKDQWESVKIGNTELKETLLRDLGFYYLYAELKKLSKKECGLE